jgi:hypothetical protein
MKKLILGVTLVFICIPLAFATLITNTNQSTHYLRVLARNASADIDAVYYNRSLFLTNHPIRVK